jgi:hypothetical protein
MAVWRTIHLGDTRTGDWAAAAQQADALSSNQRSCPASK